MKLRTAGFSIFLLLALALSACASQPAQDAAVESSMETVAPTAAMMDEMMASETPMMEDSMMASETPMMEDSMMASETPMVEDSMMASETPMMEDSMMASETPMVEDSMMASPAFLDASLINVASGESFKISDYRGQVVLVENMAIWCANCLKQQKEIVKLHEQLGMRADFASVGLDIDINETAADLKDYTARNGFDWAYAVAPQDAVREMGQLYGQQVLNPTNVPMFIIDAHGDVHPLPFGVKSAGALQEALQPYLNAGM